MATEDDAADIDALLEEPFQKARSSSKNKEKEEDSDRKKRKHRSKSRSRERDREKRRSRSPGRKRRSHSRSRSRERRRRSGSRNRNDRANRDHERRRSPPRRRRTPTPPPPLPPLRRSGPERRDVMPFTPRHSPPKDYAKVEDLTPEDRDARTVFCMQLHRNCRPRDLEEFFSSVGKVRDVRIITDSKTKRSKGISYVEFYDLEAVPLALALNGQRLLGAPMVIQPTQAEKNRMSSAAIAQSFGQGPPQGPMKLYVGSLHLNITEEMLRGIFEPFGRIDSLQLMRDDTGRSRGYGFITFSNGEDAKKAMEQLNGFELAGRAMKVGHVEEHQPTGGRTTFDSDDSDRQGFDLGSTGRLQLMAKLAEGTGLSLPASAQQLLNNQPAAAGGAAAPPIATQCFMLSNMFDPGNESGSYWDQEIRDDVIDECNKCGGVLHVFVDKASPQGNVYVKCPTIAAAVAAVNSLHGRWFAGKVITANYVPVSNYHQLFPDALQATTPLMSSSYTRG